MGPGTLTKDSQGPGQHTSGLYLPTELGIWQAKRGYFTNKLVHLTMLSPYISSFLNGLFLSEKCGCSSSSY